MAENPQNDDGLRKLGQKIVRRAFKQGREVADVQTSVQQKAEALVHLAMSNLVSPTEAQEFISYIAAMRGQNKKNVFLEIIFWASAAAFFPEKSMPAKVGPMRGIP